MITAEGGGIIRAFKQFDERRAGVDRIIGGDDHKAFRGRLLEQVSAGFKHRCPGITDQHQSLAAHWRHCGGIIHQQRCILADTVRVKPGHAERIVYIRHSLSRQQTGAFLHHAPVMAVQQDGGDRSGRIGQKPVNPAATDFHDASAAA